MKALQTSHRELFSRKVMVMALICELVLVGVYWFDIATGNHFQMLHSLFDLDSEGNIPAWFSSSQLFCVAIAFWSCAFRKKRTNRPSKLAVAGVATALAGGMGIETVGYKLFAGETSSIWYRVEVTVEEFMEMLGGTLVLVSALKLRLHKGMAAERTAQITKLQLASVNHNHLP